MNWIFSKYLDVVKFVLEYLRYRFNQCQTLTYTPVIKENGGYSISIEQKGDLEVEKVSQTEMHTFNSHHVNQESKSRAVKKDPDKVDGANGLIF